MAPALPVLAAAGGGGGGLKMPEEIHITPTTRAQGCFTGWNCCSDDNATTVTNVRIVYRQEPGADGQFAEKKSPSKAASFFKKFLCCCGSDEQTAENFDVVEQFEAVLEDRYGPVAKRFAPVRARIDLQNKKKQKDPIYRDEFETIQKKAADIFTHLDTLEIMMKQLQFFHGRKDKHGGRTKVKLDKGHKTKYRKTAPPPQKATFNVSARQRDEEKTACTQEQMIAIICGMPIHSPRGKTDKKENRKSMAQEIAGVIADTLEKAGAETITTDEMQRIFSETVDALGLEIDEPEFLQKITDENMRQAIAQKQSLEELTKDEFEEMYQIAKKLDRTALRREKPHHNRKRKTKRKKEKQRI